MNAAVEYLLDICVATLASGSRLLDVGDIVVTDRVVSGRGPCHTCVGSTRDRRSPGQARKLGGRPPPMVGTESTPNQEVRFWPSIPGVNIFNSSILPTQPLSPYFPRHLATPCLPRHTSPQPSWPSRLSARPPNSRARPHSPTSTPASRSRLTRPRVAASSSASGSPSALEAFPEHVQPALSPGT